MGQAGVVMGTGETQAPAGGTYINIGQPSGYSDMGGGGGGGTSSEPAPIEAAMSKPMLLIGGGLVATVLISMLIPKRK